MHSNSSRVVVHPFFHFLLFPPFIIPSFPSLFVPAVTDPSFLLQMRRLLCLGLCLAVVAFGVRAEEAAQNAEVDLADAFEELDESVKLDLARMLQDIFESELVLLGAALGVPGDRLRVDFMFTWAKNYFKISFSSLVFCEQMGQSERRRKHFLGRVE